MSFSLISRSLLLAGVFAAPSVFALTPSELAAQLARNETVLLVDVRSAHAFSEGHIPGAINIPLNLLRHKTLPSGQLVVVYADGLGVVDEAQALAIAGAKPGVKADVLEGGYAAWLGETRLSTAAPGITTEKLPSITYDQLVNANKSDVVVMDLRPVAAPASAKALRASNKVAASDTEEDLVAGFAQKLGVPVMTPNRGGVSAKADGATALTARSTAASAVPAADRSKLLVLVAEDEAAAAEAARELRAQGHYRFTILIGGTEAIRHEGRQGLGRMDGRAGTIQK